MLKLQLACDVRSHASRRDQEFDALVLTLHFFQESQASFWGDGFPAPSHSLAQCFPPAGALEPYCPAHPGHRSDETASFVHTAPTPRFSGLPVLGHWARLTSAAFNRPPF